MKNSEFISFPLLSMTTRILSWTRSTSTLSTIKLFQRTTRLWITHIKLSHARSILLLLCYTLTIYWNQTSCWCALVIVVILIIWVSLCMLCGCYLIVIFDHNVSALVVCFSRVRLIFLFKWNHIVLVHIGRHHLQMVLMCNICWIQTHIFFTRVAPATHSSVNNALF